MKLNDGRYEVDLDESRQLAQTHRKYSNDGYSHETEYIYSLWVSKGGKYFTVMDYEEFYSSLFGLICSGRVSGKTLMVYESKMDAASAWRSKGGQVPSEMLEPV